MTVRVTGIDTSNNDIVMNYINATQSSYPQYGQIQVNIVDASTLEMVLS